MIALLAISALLNGISYRMRGGGWFHFPSDWIGRFIFSTTTAACYLLNDNFNIYSMAVLFVFMFLDILVPHEAYANMGRWATAQKTWPAFFLPSYTNEQWSVLPMWRRTLNDFLGMMGVGFFRGLLFIVVIYLIDFILHILGFNYILPLIFGMIGLVINTLGQAFSYWVSYYIPLTITSSLQARTPLWAEFFVGVVWAVVVYV